ncbi:MAG: endonuclease/exonuclease/phosphatase family protein [Bacteroidaceae bacterium]|nr:endonuclease/exonuclease/phosphatase family protein [Bacteroidaceae bacterium]
MQRRLWILMALACLLSVQQMAAKGKISGVKPAAYTIVYSQKAEPEEGLLMAQELQRKLASATQVTLPLVGDSLFRGGKALYITHSPQMQVFDYSIRCTKGRFTIDGGGCWAMAKAVDILAGKLKEGDVPANFVLKGSVYDQELFPRPEGVNLRILDDNVWGYRKEKIPDAWKGLPADPRDDARVPQFYQLFRAYMPDVITLQEYNDHMDARLFPKLEKLGYEHTYKPKENWNNTPVIYNKNAVDLIKADYLLYPRMGLANTFTKSYTVAIFRHKATGRVFGVASTHLWWMGDARQVGSSQLRAAQVRLLMCQIELLQKEYNCPFFVCGDMNCEERSIPIQQFLQGGYEPCYKLATLYADNNNGHHICGPDDGYARQSRRISPTRDGAIDHCFLYNGQGRVEVKVFDCIQPYFTVPLTDHYPNLVDAVLK